MIAAAPDRITDYYAIYSEVNHRRGALGLSWEQVSEQADIPVVSDPAMIRDLDDDDLTRLCAWLGEIPALYQVGGAGKWLAWRLAQDGGSNEAELAELATQRANAAHRQQALASWAAEHEQDIASGI